ncbi:MAG: GNAT family N-acetyltransferase [Burkholderiales bacterium]|nr:GNAT family N-acetyltransferase [Burkholderiales bacterium]
MSIPDPPVTPNALTSAASASSPEPIAVVPSNVRADIPVAASWNWVPIRSLGPRHRERIAAHLIALEVSDRYLRFGYPASDAQISKYVDMLDFEQDEVFGIFSRRLEVIAMAHLAHIGIANPDGGQSMSEFGVSVLPRGRRRGFGRRLFEHAVLHARNRGVETLFIHALSENTAMLKIARNAGATVVREGSESDARLKLPPDTLASHVGEFMEHQAAELDYRLKVHARMVNRLFVAPKDLSIAQGETTRVAND